jgi:hypothetical protein
MDYINKLIWNEKTWLPNGCTWEQIKVYNRSDFYNAILPTAFIIYFIRYLFEKYFLLFRKVFLKINLYVKSTLFYRGLRFARFINNFFKEILLLKIEVFFRNTFHIRLTLFFETLIKS